MKRKHKNPKARKEAAKRMLMAAAKRKGMTRGALAGNAQGTANRDNLPPNGQQMDSGNPGYDMK